MRKVIYSIALLGIILGASIVFLPSLINLNHYKPEIQKAAYEALGRELTLEGDITLSLLPSPHVQLTGVHLANSKEGSEPYMMRVERIDMSIALIPLLRKHVELKKMTLVRPQIVLEHNEQGDKNWDFKREEGAYQPGDLQERKTPSSNSGVLPSTFVIQEISVRDAQITYKDPKAFYRLDDFDLAVTLKQDQAFEGEGRMMLMGKTVNINFDFDLSKDPLLYRLGLRLEGSEIDIKGTYEVSSQTIKTSVGLNLRPYDVSFIQRFIEKLPFHVDQRIQLKAALEGTRDTLQINQFDYDSDTLQFKGSGAIEPGKQRASLHVKDLPGNGSLDLHLNLDQRTSGAVEVKAQNLEKLVRALFKSSVLNVLTQPTIKESLKEIKNFALKTRFLHQGDTLNLSDLILKIQGSTLLGTTFLDFSHADKFLKLDLSLKEPGDLMALLGYQNTKTWPDGHVKGHVRFGEKHHALDVEARLLGGVCHLKGQVQPLRAHVSMTHPDATKLIALLTKNPSPLKFGPVKFDADALYNGSVLTLSNVKGALHSRSNPVNVDGNFKVHFLTQSTGIEGALDLSNLDFDALGFIETNRSDQSQTIKKAQSNRRSSSTEQWSKEPLALLGGLKNLAIDIDLSLKTLKILDTLINQAKMKLIINNGILAVPYLSGSVFGGDFKGSGTLNPQKTLFSFALNNAHLERLPVNNAAFKVLRGKTSLVANFTSQGESPHALVSQLSGVLELIVQEGVFQGFNLQSYVNLLKNLNGPQLLASLMNVMQKGETRFDRLKIALGFNNGIGTINTFDLKVPEVDVKASGVVNLPLYSLSTQWALSIPSKPELPSVSMVIEGPLDDPQKKVEMRAMQEYLIKNIFSKITQGGNPIENLLGLGDNVKKDGQSSSSSSRNDSNRQSKTGDIEKVLEKPEEVVKDILKNLF